MTDSNQTSVQETDNKILIKLLVTVFMFGMIVGIAATSLISINLLQQEKGNCHANISSAN